MFNWLLSPSTYIVVPPSPRCQPPPPAAAQLLQPAAASPHHRPRPPAGLIPPASLRHSALRTRISPEPGSRPKGKVGEPSRSKWSRGVQQVRGQAQDATCTCRTCSPDVLRSDEAVRSQGPDTPGDPFGGRRHSEGPPGQVLQPKVLREYHSRISERKISVILCFSDLEEREKRSRN